MSLYPTGGFFWNVKVVTSCSKLLRCTFVSLYPLCIFAFFVLNQVSTALLNVWSPTANMCVQGSRVFETPLAPLPLTDSKNCYKKQLVDGAYDLHAWNIENVCTHLNNAKCQSKLQLLNICNLEIFVATNYSLHKKLKVVCKTSIIYFGYNSSALFMNEWLLAKNKIRKFIEG